MVCNEEEDPKSPFNWWLKAYQVAIDFRMKILLAQGIKSQIQKIKRRAAQSQARAALAGPRKRGLGHVSAALWARARLRFGPRAAYVAPFPLVPINTPRGLQFEQIQSFSKFL